MKSKFTAAALCVAIAGCQSWRNETPRPAPMPTNQFSFNADKARTKATIISTFAPAGYRVTQDHDPRLVLERPSTPEFAARFIRSTEKITSASARVTLIITGDNPTSVGSQISVVANPGTNLEDVADLNSNAEARSTVVHAMEQVWAKLASQ